MSTMIQTTDPPPPRPRLFLADDSNLPSAVGRLLYESAQAEAADCDLLALVEATGRMMPPSFLTHETKTISGVPIGRLSVGNAKAWFDDEGWAYAESDDGTLLTTYHVEIQAYGSMTVKAASLDEARRKAEKVRLDDVWDLTVETHVNDTPVRHGDQTPADRSPTLIDKKEM